MILPLGNDWIFLLITKKKKISSRVQNIFNCVKVNKNYSSTSTVDTTKQY